MTPDQFRAAQAAYDNQEPPEPFEPTENETQQALAELLQTPATWVDYFGQNEPDKAAAFLAVVMPTTPPTTTALAKTKPQLLADFCDWAHDTGIWQAQEEVIRARTQGDD